jgi:transcriptional antiterminator NusG
VETVVEQAVQPADQSLEQVAEETAVEGGAVTEQAAAEPLPEDPKPQDEDKPKRSSDPRMQWYVVNAYSGYEMKAVKSLWERVRSMGFDEYFGDMQVPQETVVELVRGQKRTSSRKFFPGYILVQMILNEDTWHLVKETPKISGFVGDKTAPLPLAEEEVNRILGQIEEGSTSPRSRMKFEQGETVKVVDGPFSDFNGTVEEVKPDKGKVRVLISIFGRATPVEFDFVQVEKC